MPYEKSIGDSIFKLQSLQNTFLNILFGSLCSQCDPCKIFYFWWNLCDFSCSLSSLIIYICIPLMIFENIAWFVKIWHIFGGCSWGIRILATLFLNLVTSILLDISANYLSLSLPIFVEMNYWLILKFCENEFHGISLAHCWRWEEFKIVFKTSLLYCFNDLRLTKLDYLVVICAACLGQDKLVPVLLAHLEWIPKKFKTSNSLRIGQHTFKTDPWERKQRWLLLIFLATLWWGILMSWAGTACYLWIAESMCLG